MTETKKIKEISMISAIIADHYMEQIYEHFTYYLESLNIISALSIDIFEKFKNINWEDVLNNPQNYDFDNVCCWDDAIIETGAKMLNEKYSLNI
jgi:hypothetical protein